MTVRHLSSAPALLRAWLDRDGRKIVWLARQMRVHRSVISRWLQGRAVPRVVHRVQLENITDGFVPAALWRND